MKRAITFLLTVCFLANAFQGISQTRRIDSLLREMKSAHTDVQKLKTALAICEDYKAVSRDTLDFYAFYARQLAEKTNNKVLKDLAELAVASDYLRWGWGDSVLVTVTPLINRNKVGNAEERSVYFKALRLKALSYGSKSRFQEALEVLYKIINEAEQYKDTLALGENLNTIGSIALARNNPKEALKWLSRVGALELDRPEFKNIQGAVYVNMAEAYLQMNKMDSAGFFIKKGILIFKETENMFNLAMALQKQSAIFIATGQLHEAEQSLKEMIQYRSESGDRDMYLDDNISMIDFYIETKQIDKAIELCKQVLATGNLHNNEGDSSRVFANNINIQLEYFKKLAQCYKIKGDEKLYAETLEKIINASDSFYQVNSAEAIAELQTKYEVQKKENTIMQQTMAINRKNSRFYVLTIIAVFVVLTLAIWFFSFRKREKYKLRTILEKEKLLAAQSVAKAEENERKRIAADLHDNLGTFAAAILSNLDLIQPLDEAQSKSAIHELRNNSQAVVSQLHDTIWALKKDALPLTSISDRIKLFIQRIQPSYPNISINVVEKIDQDDTLSPAHAFHLFRIIQEALNNSLRHSKAKEIIIGIQSNDKEWSVTITDDGTGIDISNTKGNGLVNMKERAKEAGMKIEWVVGEVSGTKVIISKNTSVTT